MARTSLSRLKTKGTLMIYRAFDCGIYGRRHERVATVWFQAPSDGPAGAKLMQLLALAWDVPVEDVLVGNVDSELAIERSSIQSAAAGPGRWFESGCWDVCGGAPTFDLSDQLLFLNTSGRDQYYVAKAAAITEASKWRERFQKASGKEVDKADAAYYIDELTKFIGGVRQRGT